MLPARDGARDTPHPESDDEVNDTGGPDVVPPDPVPAEPWIVPVPALPERNPPDPAAPAKPLAPVGPGQLGGGIGHPWLWFHASSAAPMAPELSAMSCDAWPRG